MTNFGKYDLLERLASGGMAELFLARQTGVGGFSKTVVIKRIHKHLSADYEFTTMFINEARVSAQLSHQNIVQVYDFGEHDGSYFIAMEYVFGQDLKSVYKLARKKRIQMPLPLAIYIIQQVCKGLDYAHRKKDSKGRPQDIVHRDVSPQNILLSYEGEIKVADFGIAKAASSSRMTQAGTLKGKIAYMSPEQAWGKTVDKRSDIFSIGIVFWEILTNQRLFFGNSDFDTLERVRNCDIPDITQLVPSISKEIDRILRKALSKDPETRYQSAADMHHDLEVFSAAHGFYNQSPELANFLRAQFLAGDDNDDISQSGSHPRVLTADGAISESSQPIEVIERTDSSKKVLSGAPIPVPAVTAPLPPVAQQIVAQARDATKPPPRPVPHEHEDDTYQAPPLSEEFLRDGVASSPPAKMPPPRSERSGEQSSVRRRDPAASGSTAAPPEPVKVEAPLRRTTAKVSVPNSSQLVPTVPLQVPSVATLEEKDSKEKEESRRPTRRVAPPREKPLPPPPPPPPPQPKEEVVEEDWEEEEWDEAEAPRSSSLVAVLTLVLVVAVLAVGGIGFYVLREKGLLLPASWLPPGRIVIQALPEARVFLGDQLKGTTDASGKLNIPDITAGSYDIKIVKEGHADLTKRVRVKANKGSALTAYPDPLRGKLTVVANEPGARVYVDGVYYGRAATERSGNGYKAELEYVPPGDRVITLAKAGRRDAEARVGITAGANATSEVKLEPGPLEWVELSIEVDQRKSFVILDGEFKGEVNPGTPLALKLEQGIHDLAIYKSSFDPVYDPVVFRQKTWTRQALKANFKEAIETGMLKIVTTAEGYDLLVDGREILHGIRREATLPGIPQGKHTVRIVHPTLGTEAQEVVLAAGKSATVSFTLGGSAAQIVAKPDGATVMLDGKFQGVSKSGTPISLSLPKSGSFKLEVTAPGHKSFQKTYQVSEVTEKLEVELQKE